MLDLLPTIPIGLAIAALAIVSFIAGRISVNDRPKVPGHAMHLHEAQAAREFAQLPDAIRAEVDRLVAEWKSVQAMRLLQAEMNADLHEAKVIIDQRKRSAKFYMDGGL